MDVLGLTPSRIWVAIAATTALVACAPQSAPSLTPSPAVTRGAPMLTGSISVEGDFAIASTFVRPAQIQVGSSPSTAPATTSCVDYAKGFSHATAFAAPEIHTTGDPNVYFQATLTGYKGPGTYSGRFVPGLNGAAAVTFGSPSAAVQVYNPRRGGTTTLTVAADGSGSFTFSRWTTTEVRGGNIAGYLDGSVEWVCRSS